MAQTTWDPTEQTIKSILDAYLLPSETPPPNPATAETGKASGAPAGTPSAAAAAPPYDAGDAGAAPPAPTGSGTPASAHVPAKRRQCPKWDGPDYLNLPNAEDKKHEMPPTGPLGPQPRNDEELTQDEAKQLRLEDAYRANGHFVLMYGYKMPFVRRLDPTAEKTKELVDFIQEVRSRLPKVPVNGLATADPGSAPVDGAIGGVPDAASGSNPYIRLNLYDGYQLQFNVRFAGVVHDVTKNTEWTVDDPAIVSLTNGRIQARGKKGKATVTATWKSVTKQLDVEIDVRPNPNRSTVGSRGKGPKIGMLNWVPYGSRHGWMYDDDPADMPPAFYGQLHNFVMAIKAGEEATWAATTIVRKISQEGSSSSINTYDDQVLTLGSGNAAANAVNLLADGSEASADVKKLLYIAGLAVEKMPQYKLGNSTPQCVKMVDLSEPSKPRILYFDNLFHFYGWANRAPGSKTPEPIKPAKRVAPTPTFEVSTYDPDNPRSGAIVNNTGRPFPHSIFQHFTPSATPADESFGTEKNNIELLHAMIAVRKSVDPPTGLAFFNLDWNRSISHIKNNVTISPLPKVGSVTVGMRAAFIFLGMMTHNWELKDVASFPDRYLQSTEVAAVKAGVGVDPYRNALVCKAAARAVAVKLEQGRITTAFVLAKQKKLPVSLATLDGMKSAFWGYGRVMNYWHEMVGEPGPTGEKASVRLALFKSKCKPDVLAKLLADAGITEAQLDGAAKDEVLTLPAITNLWTDGFDTQPKTNVKQDVRMLYAKDFTDGNKTDGKIDTRNHQGAYLGDGTAVFCVGPKDQMSDLPALVKSFDRGVDLVKIDATKPRALVGAWAITKASHAQLGKFVLTDGLGNFLDADRKPTTAPVFFDTNPLG